MNDQNSDLHDDQLSNIYQQTKVEEPPMALDSAILTEARKAVEKPAKRPVWKRLGLMESLATVGIVMLTVSVMIQMKHEQPESMAPVMMDAAPMQEQETTSEEDRTLHHSGSRAPAKGAVEKKDVPVPTGKAEQREAAPTIAPQSAKRMLKMQTRQPAQAPVSSGTAALGAMDAESEAAGAAQFSSKPTAELSIPAWLKQIRNLIKGGKLDEARKSLKAFKKAHPDFSLPKDITTALK